MKLDQFSPVAISLCLTCMLGACGGGSSSPATGSTTSTVAITTTTTTTTTTSTSAATTTTLPPETVPSVLNKVNWVQTSFRSQAAPLDPRHVNRVVTTPAGRLLAAWYTQDSKAYISFSDDKGITWTHKPLDRMTQVHQFIRLSNGTLLAGGESVTDAPMLWYSTDNGLTWQAGATGGALALPNPRSDIIWDLAERQGEVIITTSAETNAPNESHEVVYAWNPSSKALRALGALRGMGALAVAVKGDGTIYVSTQDSSEHDDPATAGEGRVYRSTDGGVSWIQTESLASANRIYALTVLSDGTVVAGSGLNGGFYLSRDGNSWQLMSRLPDGQKMLGTPPVLTTLSVSRVYKTLELASGALLVSTGNETGDFFISCDRGVNWISTAETGGNNVAWGLAQAGDGTIWIGNGSVLGDVWKAVPPAAISPEQFFACSH